MKMENLLFEKTLHEFINSDQNQLNGEISEFIFAPSKRIRPRLVFACLKASNLEITKEHKYLALAVEILHNATLIHDDIIDKGLLRRGLATFYKKYDEKMSVILGDYLFSLSLKALCKTNNLRIFEIFTETMREICNGEIEQYLLKDKIPTFEQYIEKSKKKTALLFILGIKCALILSGIENKNFENFALNYGIAFQLKNDLNAQDDRKNGVYTLNDIYLKQYGANCDIIKKCNGTIAEFTDKARSYAKGYKELTRFLDE